METRDDDMKHTGTNAHIKTQYIKEGLVADLSLATSSPTNGGNSVNKQKRVRMDELQKYRLKLQGAERSLATIKDALKKNDRDLASDSITSTQRKMFQAQRVKWLVRRDAANSAMMVASQRVNSYLSRNTQIASRERLQTRKEGDSLLKIEKLTFSLRTFYKDIELTVPQKAEIAAVVQKEDLAALRGILANAISANKKLRVKLPEVGTSESTAVLKSMHKWFQTFLKPKKNQISEAISTKDAA